jgi:transcriptional regulator with XRE-family HTH domain
MIGKKIRELAEKKGISLKDLAYKSEIAEPTLHNILTRNDAKLSQLDKIAEVLGVSTSYFMGETQENKILTQKNEEPTILLEKNARIEELKESNSFLKEQLNFFKNFLIPKLDRLEKYNFGLNEGGGLGKGSDVLGVVSNCFLV